MFVCALVLDERLEGHLQYADDRRRQSDISSRRDRRGTVYLSCLPVESVSVISLIIFSYVYSSVFLPLD